jgi:type IV secretion system protein VirB6
LASQFFQNLWTGYDQTLLSGSQAAASSLLTAVQPELVSALGLFVIVTGILMSLGRLDYRAGILNMVRAIMVANLLQAANYNTWVETMFLTTIPNWITGAVGGGAAGASVAAQFDLLRSAVNHLAASLLEAASGFSVSVAVTRLSISLAAEFAVGMLVLGFFVDFIAQGLVALVAPVGAVVMVAYLFTNTRHWAERWIGKLVALMILELLVAILMTIVETQFRSYMLVAEANAASGINLDEAVDVLWSIGWSFFFGIALLICLPAIAAAIGGSHVSTLVITHLRFGGAAIGAIGRSSAAAAGRPAAARPSPASNNNTP